MSIRCPYYIDFDVRDVHDGLDSVMAITTIVGRVHRQNVEVTNAESTKRRTTKRRMGQNAERQNVE